MNLLFIQKKFIIIKSGAYRLEQACELWNATGKGKKYIYKMGYRPRTDKISIEALQRDKLCKGMALINEMKKMWCCNAYDFSIKVSPVTPISNKVVGFSDFPLILIIHREIKGLFEIFTEFAGVKINVKIKKRDGLCKRLDVKITFFLDWSLGGFQSWTGPVVVKQDIRIWSGFARQNEKIYNQSPVALFAAI